MGAARRPGESRDLSRTAGRSRLSSGRRRGRQRLDVTPAKAGAHVVSLETWAPAFAGATHTEQLCVLRVRCRRRARPTPRNPPPRFRAWKSASTHSRRPRATRTPAISSSAEQRLRDLIEEIELADQVGLDVFGVGEHHRPDFVVSTPAVVLAAAAARTTRIRLTSAVTRAQLRRPGARVPGVRDARPALGRPRRDHGRARVVHRVVPAVRLRPARLRHAVRREARPAARSCATRSASRGRRQAPPPIAELGVYPRPVQEPLPVWIAVGGTPQSVVRAATLGLPLAVAIIGGAPDRFVPLVDLYRDAARRAGHDPATLPVSINSHGFVADDATTAADDVLAAVRRGHGAHRPRARVAAADARAVRRADRRRAARCSSAARRRSSTRSCTSTSSSAGSIGS